jgi:acyl-homoserine-lactone acylase
LLFRVLQEAIAMSSRFTMGFSTCAAFAALALAGCSSDDDEPSKTATLVRYTEFGIPHIRANDYESAGFAQGYAQARDNLCKIERGMLALDGELSRYFGPDAPGTELIGIGSRSLPSDLYFRGVNQGRIVERLLEERSPLGPRDEVREMVRGYVDGFNRFLEEEHATECAGAEWLRPMTELDVYRRVYAVSLRMGQAFFASAIVAAEPPASTTARLESPRIDSRFASVQRPDEQTMLPGSNAIAIGGSATASGGGINVANPHLSWNDDIRWWQSQVTIPGRLDVSGASFLGQPLVVMGHTASVSFSITTAEDAWRCTAFELTLEDGSPTTYLVDGAPEAMERREVSVAVKQPDGSLETVRNVQWWTRFGPVIGEGSFLPVPPWNAGGDGQPGHAYAVRDANATNLRMLNTLFAFNHAKSSRDVLEALRETQGAPWWTVAAADADGEALLSQIHVVPNVTDEHAAACNTELGRAIFPSSGIAILDASRSACDWESDADAVEDGIFGPGALDAPGLPYALSRRYLENSNNSHWLPSADVRITGMPRIVGSEGTERNLRTRGLIAELERRLDGGPLTRQAVQELLLSNRSYAADLAVDSTVEICRNLPDGAAQATSGESVGVREACEILARWDHAMDVDSAGALLFTRYWTHVTEAAKSAGTSPWTVPFDAEDPVVTPNTLDAASPLVPQALADAVLELSNAGIALDAKLGDYQYALRGGRRIPIGGGGDALGVANVMEGPFGAEGFIEGHYGSAYIHVVAFDGSACPDAATLLAYSQSDDTRSRHHLDQTERYSQKEWVRERFCEKDILASPELEIIELETKRAHFE